LHPHSQLFHSFPTRRSSDLTKSKSSVAPSTCSSNVNPPSPSFLFKERYVYFFASFDFSLSRISGCEIVIFSYGIYLFFILIICSYVHVFLFSFISTVTVHVCVNVTLYFNDYSCNY